MAYRTVHERFWRDPKVLRLSSKDKLLFVYLITSADAHYSGVYYCPLQMIQLETGLSEKDVAKGIDTLSKGYMVEYDKGSNEVFVINMAKFQVVSKQQIQGVVNHFKESVQSQTLKASFIQKYDTLSIPYTIPCQIPIDTTETETERETESKEKVSKDTKKTVDTFKPSDLSDKVWTDFKKVQKDKRASITETRMEAIEKKGKKAGLTLAQTITVMTENSWQGFKKDWYDKLKGKQTGLIGNDLSEESEREFQEACDRKQGKTN